MTTSNSGHTTDIAESDEATIVIMGASYARAWPVRSVGPYRVINVGIDGNQSFEMANRFSEDVLRHNPDKVLIWGFINDIHRSEPGKIDDTKRRAQESFESMIATAQAADIDVILATEVTIREQAGFTNWLASVLGSAMGKTSYQETVNGHVNDVNKWIKSNAELHNLPLLDFEQALAGKDGKRLSEFAQDDGSHLTPAAYDALSKFTEEELHLTVK